MDDWTSVTDIKSACNWLGDADEDVKEYKLMMRSFGISSKTLNQKALEVCIKAINTTDGRTWTPDFTNKNQRKWYNWFEKAGSGWLVYCTDAVYCRSGVGSAFYFESEEKARHGAKYFKSYYGIWLE